MKDDMPTRVFLWSGPRNISTALMYSFAQRADTKVFDEPLYAFYLTQTPAKEYHPGVEDILASMESDGEKVVRSMLENTEKPVLFFKNMCHHLLDLDRAFMKKGKNVILTRDPVEMLSSFGEVIENPKMNDVGYRAQVELLHDLKSRGIDTVVVDSKTILMDPEGQLRLLCERSGIPFDPAMLSWEAGPREEDGVWAPYWYGSVHKSTGFAPYQPKLKSFPDKLKPLLEECMPYYEELMGYKIG